MKRAFTLVEMTIVLAIIAIMALMALPAINAAYQQSRGHRTRAIIAKIDGIIGEKYEAYRTRQVPIRIPPGTNPAQAAQFRLNAIRELMRLEMPDRITDITYNPVVLPALPSLTRNYRRRALATWDNANENAECLYLILAATRDNDKNALDYFAPSEIGDTDNDGMKEILDAWGQPIVFLRWAPGYRADVLPYPVTPQRRNESGLASDPTTLPDQFDPIRIDFRYRDNNPANDPFALKPLIISGGPDRRVAVNPNTPSLPVTFPAPTPYSLSSPANDPYFPDPNTGMPVVGLPFGPEAADNITNHDLESR